MFMSHLLRPPIIQRSQLEKRLDMSQVSESNIRFSCLSVLRDLMRFLFWSVSDWAFKDWNL